MTISGRENLREWETSMSDVTFGSCCEDLAEAMTKPENPAFFVEENGVLYLSIGFAETEEGLLSYDMAAIHCPFCGKHLQDKEAVAAAEDAEPE